MSGAIAGLAGPEAGPLGGLAAHALIGAASGAGGQLVSNLLNHKPLGDGVLMAGLIGGATGGLARAAGPWISRGVGRLLGKEADSVAEGVGKDLEGAACPLSFAPNTPVATPSGEQPIASLKVGDHVTAYDPSTGKTSTQTVQHVWINHDTDLIDLTLHTDAPKAAQDLHKARTLLDGDPLSRAPPPQHTTSATQHGLDEVVHTTAKHPFLTAERGWVPAGQLTAGMHVLREDGTTAVVVREHVVPGTAAMWNLTVSNLHTYAVGAGQYVVHNCGDTLADGTPARITQRGLSHSFSRHAADWFGRAVGNDDIPAWEGAIRRVMKGGEDNIFDSSVRGTQTRAILGRVPFAGRVRYMVVHFFTEGPYSGELAGAREPKSNELTGFFRALGRLE